MAASSAAGGLASLRTLASAAEGRYVQLAPSPLRIALLLDGVDASPMGVVLPLDALLEDRIAITRQLYRLLTGGIAGPADLSRYRRERLKLALRALDGKLDGAGYREVARGLFPRLAGHDREPSEAIVGRAIRLVRYGVQLMRGGYLDLLRPERRASQRPRRHP